MSLRWIMYCWGGRASQGTAVLGMCCAWLCFPWDSVSTVAPWCWHSDCFACILPWGKWGGVALSKESWGQCGTVGFVGQCWTKAVVQHNSVCTQKLLCTAPCFPGLSVIPLEDFYRPWRPQESGSALFRWFRLGFCAFEKKGRELSAAVVDLTLSAQLHHKTALTFLSCHLCWPQFACPHNKGHEGAKISGEFIQSKPLKF